MHTMRASSRMAADDEQSLVARARTDADAFGALYDFYLPRIHGFLMRRTQDRAVAEDLTATTFERALDAIRRGAFRNESFGGWLYRVASNAAIDDARRQRRVLRFDWSADARHDDPRPSVGDIERATDAFAAAIERNDLRRALGRLPARHRRVLLLRYFDDLDPDEAGAVLGCSKRTFAVKLHRALAALRGALASEATDAA